MAQPTNKQKPN